MVPDKFERYAVSYGPEGLHIRMRQALRTVGCGVLAFGMLAACLVGALDVGWAGTGFCVVLVAFVAMCAAWTEDWIITVGEIRYRNSFHIKERCVRRSGEPVALRVEVFPPDSDGDLPQFPHVVHLIGPDGEEVGYGFAFRRISNLNQFLETLRLLLPLDVDDHKQRKGGVDGPRKSPSAMSDRWLD